jgi:Leucine-rich repeat (LRR) protein
LRQIRSRVKEGSREAVPSEDHFSWQDEVVSISSFKKLVLSNLRFKAVDPNIVPFNNLLVLNLSFNRIFELSGISHLRNLKILDVSHNKIAELDPLKDMTSLEILRFNDNIIEKLHPLWAMTSMKQLWASNNRISWE